ncbi:hypothetical protein TBS_32060 [Thermobispora bispora]
MAGLRPLGREVVRDLFPAVADDDDQPFGVECAGCGEHVIDERAPTDLVEDFGGLRLHPGALACGEDEDGGRALHTHSLSSLGIAAGDG